MATFAYPAATQTWARTDTKTWDTGQDRCDAVCSTNGLPVAVITHDFPPWETVYGYFRKLGAGGDWERINHVLRAGIREQAGREPDPSVVIVDSQSVKTTEKKGMWL